ncbi:MAG TPA: ATP synthase A1 subunit C [Actinobacteria bacterium]|nr:ATP synthase A1 subunit C [Actinomycetota bacterium]
MTTVEYGYVAARLRGMKSNLLDKAFFEQLLAKKNITEIIIALEQTVYKKDIHRAILQNVESVENGLQGNIIGTFSSLRKMVDGRVHQLVDILLGRWDVQNLKTILRGLHQFAGFEQIVSSLVPAGSIPETVLEELARQKDVRSCVNLMATWSIPYSKALTENYSAYTQDMNLQPLELSLDKMFFEQSLRSLSRRSLDACLVREVLMREIDIVNIMTLLRLTREGSPQKQKMELFLSGGKQVKERMFNELADHDDIADVISGLAKTSYKRPLARGWDEFISTGRFSRIERSLESYLINANIRLFLADPLSVAVIIAFIWAKLNEIVNLRIILRGQNVGMPEEKIREALVFS